MGSRFLTTTIAGALAALLANAAAASDKTDAAAIVRHYGAELNKGDVAAMSADCAPDVAIIDDFAPHIWRGPTAVGDWFSGLQALDKSEGTSHLRVGIVKITHVEITGDRAYVVAALRLDYLRHGKATFETGAWTFALHKETVGWRIAGWAWADH
jgi:ketosteroid isomerase-like protein